MPQDTDSAIYKFFVAAQEESARCADDIFKQVVDERLETIVPIKEMATAEALDFGQPSENASASDFLKIVNSKDAKELKASWDATKEDQGMHSEVEKK